LTEFDIINVALPFLGLSTTKINILLETAVTMLREGGYLFITGIDDDIYRKIVPVEYNVATSNYVKRWLRSHKFEEIQEINSGVSKVDVSSEDREAIFCAYFESILQEMKAAGAEYEYSPYHSEYIWCLKNKDRVRESMMDENFRLYLGFTCFRSTKR
jgi:hypothetical protein